MRNSVLSDICTNSQFYCFVLVNLTEVLSMNEFGNQVKKILIDKNMTQTEIATVLHVQPNTVNNYLNKPNVTIKSMEKVAHVLGCKLQITLVPDNTNDTNA